MAKLARDAGVSSAHLALKASRLREGRVPAFSHAMFAEVQHQLNGATDLIASFVIQKMTILSE
jgi:hypothetical protein